MLDMSKDAIKQRLKEQEEQLVKVIKQKHPHARHPEAWLVIDGCGKQGWC
jgi:hypothetical protein